MDTGCIAPLLRVCSHVRLCARVLGVVFARAPTTSVCTVHPSAVFDLGKQLICLVRVCLGLETFAASADKDPAEGLPPHPAHYLFFVFVYLFIYPPPLSDKRQRQK